MKRGISMIERQELHCHNCNKYVQFDIDLNLNGNHVLKCPNCGHEHCRVVKDGIITDDRWDRRNTNSYNISGVTITVSSTSTYNSYVSASTTTSTGSVFIYSSWMNTVTT